MARIKRWITDSIITSFLQWLMPAGFWPWIASVIVAAATVIGGYLYRLPWPFLIVLGATVLAICAVAVNQFSEWYERRSTKSQRTTVPKSDNTGFEFIPTLDELRMRHPISETFKAGNDFMLFFCLGRFLGSVMII